MKADKKKKRKKKTPKTRVKWTTRYEELKQYQDRFGNCNVPTGWLENPELAVWVMNQRAHYRKAHQGKKSPITQDTIEQMNAIGFEWDAQQATWLLRYEQLRIYKDRYGDCNVPVGWEEDPQLATWVMNQRAQLRKILDGKKSPMTEERIEKLNDVGFDWSLRRRKKADAETCEMNEDI